MWNIVKYTMYGIAWGFTWLVCMGVILSLCYPPAFEAMMGNFPEQALGAAAVGVSSTLPALVYRTSKIPYATRFLVHAAIAMGVFFPVAFGLRWIPYQPERPDITIIEILSGIGIFLAIWYVFYLINRREARKINMRVHELKSERNTHNY